MHIVEQEKTEKVPRFFICIIPHYGTYNSTFYHKNRWCRWDITGKNGNEKVIIIVCYYH